MMNRRDFIRTGALGAAAATLEAAPARMPQAQFGLHPFIEANPKAVFIRRTKVPHKMHEESKLRDETRTGRCLRVSVNEARAVEVEAFRRETATAPCSKVGPPAFDTVRHVARAGGWKKLEPMWGWVVRVKRVCNLLRVLLGHAYEFRQSLIPEVVLSPRI